MVISEIEIIQIGRPPELTQGIAGEFLVTPLHTFPDYEKILGERFVGLRGGPVGGENLPGANDEEGRAVAPADCAVVVHNSVLRFSDDQNFSL